MSRRYAAIVDAFDLTDRVAVVTGGNRGIGFAMARGLLKAGASVAIWSRNEQRNLEAAMELAEFGDAEAFSCDVSNGRNIAAAMDATFDRFGRLDAFFANAGTTGIGFVDTVPLEEWNRVLEVNLTGVFLTVQEAIRRMIDQGEGGSIIVVSSVAGSLAIPQAAHYSTAKGAVRGLVFESAASLTSHGIRLNVLSPGWVKTDLSEEVQANEALNEAILKRTPMRRWGTPEDFEGVAVFLASDASAYVSGAELVVDGGLLAS